ncbi:MAG: hypothetical protein Q9157_007786 [Trypethelium eluteriae]
MSDLNLLFEMGFEKEKAELAIKKGGNLQGAIEWLETNQDKTIEELKAEEESAAPTAPDDSQANSLVCQECGKRMRGTAEAEYHASKTQHTDFEQSTEEIKPLTEEERATRLEELRAKLAVKRANEAVQDKADQKRNEQIRMKSTKETQDIKEELQKKEQIKEAEKKRKEKQDDIDAKKRIKAKIEADKEARRLKAEQEKAARAGVAPPVQPAAPAMPTTSGPATSKPASAYTEARLRLQTVNGTVQKTLPVETTLFEVAHQLAQDNGTEVATFTTNFPKKVFDRTDFGMTLKEAGLVPSAALIVK